MFLTKSRPNEFLVVGRRGRLRSLGAGASAFLLPGSTFVRIPSAKQEAGFQMTQESRDGVPLRFKGIVIYRVEDPAVAATAFDFSDGRGHDQIQAMLAHVALGELRDLVSHLSVKECIEQRKTTLTDAVQAALRGAVSSAQAGEATGSWGIEIDLVQVGQVFIVDEEIRSNLEAELRNEILERSKRSDIQMAEELERARLASARRMKEEELETARETTRVQRERVQLHQELALEEAESEATTHAAREESQVKAREQVERARKISQRRLEQEELESARETNRVEREKLELEQAVASDRVERKAVVKRLTLERQAESLDLELAVRRKVNELRALEVEAEMVAERERQALELEILPLRQVPAIAEAFAGVYQGADLSIYAADDPIARTVAPLADLLGAQLRRAFQTGRTAAAEKSHDVSSGETA